MVHLCREPTWSLQDCMLLWVNGNVKASDTIVHCCRLINTVHPQSQRQRNTLIWPWDDILKYPHFAYVNWGSEKFSSSPHIQVSCCMARNFYSTPSCLFNSYPHSLHIHVYGCPVTKSEPAIYSHGGFSCPVFSSFLKQKQYWVQKERE